MAKPKPSKKQKYSEKDAIQYDYDFGFPFKLFEVLSDITQEALKQSLKHSRGNIEQAAALLYLPPHDFVKLAKQYKVPIRSKNPWVQ